jgi:hypothetical protein
MDIGLYLSQLGEKRAPQLKQTVAVDFRAINQHTKRNVKILHLRPQTRWNEIRSAYFIARKYQPSSKLSEYV